MGVGGQHASILTAFLDLPEPHKWPRQFSTVEKFLHKSTEKVRITRESNRRRGYYDKRT
jgi:hypothetical protein